MSFNGAQINKINGGLGGDETTDRVAVLVVGTSLGSVEQNKPYELLQVDDLQRLGFSETDEKTGDLTYYHVSEVFRLSPETRFYMIAVPSATKPSDLKNLTPFLSALRSIEGVNTIAIANLTEDADLQTATSGLQLVVDNLAKEHVYIDAVLMEGVGGYLKETLAEYDDLRSMASPNISVVIGQDPFVAAMHEKNESYAAVGSALGMLLVRAVHENLGSVDIEVKPSTRKGEQDYTLTDSKKNRFLSATLSNGTSFATLSLADQKKLDELGYIYIGSFSGYGGCFFSNSHTCEELESDYSFIERNAIWNKAARSIRFTLLPRVRSKVETDPVTGYIKSTTLSDWDGRVRKALERMVTSGNIADFDILIPKKQSAVTIKPFYIQVKLVADGIVHEFKVDLGLTNKI